MGASAPDSVGNREACYRIDRQQLVQNQLLVTGPVVVRFFDGETELGAVSMAGAVKSGRLPRPLRDHYLDAHLFTFLSHLFLKSDPPPSEAAGAPRCGDLESIRTLAREFAPGGSDGTPPGDALALAPARVLCRIGLDCWHRRQTQPEPASGQPGPALVIWAFGREDPPELASLDWEQVFVFRIAPGFPDPLKISRHGRVIEACARRLALLDVARVLAGLGEGRPVVFWPGPAPVDVPPVPTPPRAGCDIFCTEPIPAESEVRPLDASALPAGDASSRRLSVHQAVNLLLRGSFESVPFQVMPARLLRHLPPEEGRFASRQGLLRSIRMFLLQLLICGGELRLRPGGRRPIPAGLSPAESWRTGRESRKVLTLSGPVEPAGGRLWEKTILDAIGRKPSGRQPAWNIHRLAGYLGWLAGPRKASPKRRFLPLLTVPDGPAGELGLDLLSGTILWERVPAGSTTLFATFHLGDIPCGCLGFPVFCDGSAQPARLAAQAEEEALLHLSGRILRQMGQLLIDQPGGPAISGHGPRVPPVEVASRPSMELVVATRDRTGTLQRLLESVSALRQPVPVRVVDSDPSGSGTRDLADARAIPYHLCPVPGKSRALNLGIAASTADVILFSDDDAVVHPDWSARLAEGFRDGHVACVNGLVLPWRVNTPAQLLFEMHMEELELGGLRRGFVEREFRRPFSPFRSAHLGSGANMAVRRSVFEEIGPFDEALSPGTHSRAGEEIDLYFRLLRKDRTVLYNPRAIVWHDHREQLADLERLLVNYGVSAGATAMRWLLRERQPRAVYYLWRWNIVGLLLHAWRRRAHYPAGLCRREAFGCLAGPGCYLRSAWRQNSLSKKVNRA